MRRPFSVPTARALVTKDVLYGPSYVGLTRGAHMVAGESLDHGRRIQATRAAMGMAHILVGVSAAWVHGCRLADSDEPVHLVSSRRSGLRRRDHVMPYRFALSETDVLPTPFGLATSPVRTAIDLARGIGPDTFGGRVAAVDAFLRTTRLGAAAIRTAFRCYDTVPGSCSAREVLRAARDGVDSPKETQLRLLVASAGLAAPEVQCRVQDRSGRFIASLDMGWRLQRVGLEYDGAVHLEASNRSYDLHRHNLLRQAGWLVIQIDARGLRRWETVAGDLASLLLERTP